MRKNGYPVEPELGWCSDCLRQEGPSLLWWFEEKQEPLVCLECAKEYCGGGEVCKECGTFYVYEEQAEECCEVLTINQKRNKT